MYKQLEEVIEEELRSIRNADLYKEQHVISGRQGPIITIEGKKFLNFSSNDYLGLAGKEELVEESKKSLDIHGYGLSSVRFISGTFDVHKVLEEKIAEFFHKDSAITFNSCFDANQAVFSSLLSSQDAVFSDELNHASIIDGIRSCKAERQIYKHMDMVDLEDKLKDASDKRLRCIVTDGIFSMEGEMALLKEICDLAEKYDAFVIVDDSHATGFLGATGRGSMEEQGVLDKVDIITTTFSKALGGANGGCIIGPEKVIEVLQQKARTILFSNAMSAMVAGTTLFVLDYIDKHPELREKLLSNTRYFHEKMSTAGFTLPKSIHPIVSIMIGDEKVTNEIAKDMFEEGIYVVAFTYPIVARGKSRIRVQISALHEKEQLDTLAEAFERLGRGRKIIKSRREHH